MSKKTKKEKPKPPKKEWEVAEKPAIQTYMVK
jgi:hypothetical protein